MEPVHRLSAILDSRLRAVPVTDADFAVRAVETILAAAEERGASDIHFRPSHEGLHVEMRLDGVLQPAALIPAEVGPNVVARLKVQAELLTYRTDVPQEGRLTCGPGELERRVCTCPTLYGEKAIVRLFARGGALERIADLALPPDVADALRTAIGETAGAVLITGPAGSGKTTTAYACLREIVDRSGGGRSIVSLEDPIEVALAGVAQTQVKPEAGFDLAAGLRFLLRQDPEVLLVGEIRDAATAVTTFQGALTGHLVVTTFHSATAAAAINRLTDMGIEPFLLRSSLLVIVNQRLVRRLCSCAATIESDADLLGLGAERGRRPVGCAKCAGAGYQGRMVLAEFLKTTATELGRSILSRDDAARIEELAVRDGMIPHSRRVVSAVEAGLTSPGEIRRVFGWGRGAEA